MTQPKSDSATSATKRILSEASLRAMTVSCGAGGSCGAGICGARGSCGARRSPRERGEVIPALLEVPVLIERGAGRRQEHRVALPRELRGGGHGALHRLAAHDRGGARERGLDERR